MTYALAACHLFMLSLGLLVLAMILGSPWLWWAARCFALALVCGVEAHHRLPQEG